ncbi:MAG: VWA domain-containing protein [Bacteroidetes bacterium]|nr:VWA domain-containing protein [Bacteroidota bacterium]
MVIREKGMGKKKMPGGVRAWSWFVRTGKTYVLFLSLLLLIVLPGLFFTVRGQKPQEKEKPKPLTRILFVFDASQSMYGRWQSDMKINIAQKLLSNLLDSLMFVDNLELALRVYGHQKPFPPQDCDDSKLEVPFSDNNIKKIKHVLKLLVPKGTTPIAYSLEKSAKDFPPCDNCRNIIILITDGLEECSGDPCAVSRALQKQGVILKPFIIGIGKDFKNAFDCVGTYFDASEEANFSKALNVVISQALNSTTAQVNLLDQEDNPTETNVGMTFYDSYSGLIKYNFIHTLNSRGIPDTLYIDPLLTYNLVVHTIPTVEKDSIILTPGKHTIIPVTCPQGYLQIKVGGSNANLRNLQCIVRRKGKMATLNVQPFNTTEKYLVGSYDLEILCLPRLMISDVEVLQSNTTTVEIPVPGIAVIQKTTNGYGSLFVEEDNRLKWIYNFRDNAPNLESLILQPGKYRAVFRSKFTDRTIYTVEKTFRVESGETVNVKLYQN